MFGNLVVAIINLLNIRIEMISFFIDGPSEDLLYRELRDGSETVICDARNFTNDLWEYTSNYVDTDIQASARDQFHQRFWEMYLIATLLKRGFPVIARELRRDKSKGPDIQVGDVIAWFEAIAPNQGDGPDRVQGLDNSPKNVENRLNDKVPLRLTHAIKTKHKKYKKYCNDSLVKENEPFVIALNARLIPDIGLGAEV